MLVVPGYKQQYAYENPGQSFSPKLQGMQVGSSAEMFGGAAGRTLERAGYALQRSAHEMAHIYDDDQSTRVREKAVQMQRDFLSWQSGMKQKAGRDGMSAADDYDSWAEEQLRTLRQDLAPEERDVFADLMVKRLNAQRSWANKHALAQNSVYKESVWDEEISAGRELVAANMDEEELVDVALEQIKDAVFTQGKHSGFTDADIMNLTSENVSTALALPMVKWIQEGDRETALSYMEKYHDQLSPTAKHYLATLLEQGSTEADADTANAPHEAAPQAAQSAQQAVGQAPQAAQAPTAAEGNDADNTEQQPALESLVKLDSEAVDAQAQAQATAERIDASMEEGREEMDQRAAEGTLVADAAQTDTKEEKESKRPEGLFDARKKFDDDGLKEMEKHWRKYKPAMDMAMQLAGVPESLFLPVAILESELKPKAKGGGNSTAAGIMQVTEGTRKDIRKYSTFDAQKAEAMEKNTGDATLYYGALYLQKHAKDLGVELSESTPLEELQKVYMRYFLGPTGYTNFSLLGENESVKKSIKNGKEVGLSKNVIQGNSPFFSISGNKKGPIVSKKEAARRINERFESCIEIYNTLKERMKNTSR